MLARTRRIAFHQDNLKQAKGWLHRAIQHFPASPVVPEAQLTLSRVYQREGNFRVAEQVLFDAPMGPADVGLNNAIGLEKAKVAVSLGKLDEAIKHSELILSQSTEAYWVDLATALRIDVAQQNSNWPKVRELATAYVARNIQGSNAFNIRMAGGIAAYKSNEYGTAFENFEDLMLQLEPSEFARADRLNYWLALCELGQGQSDLAAARLQTIDQLQSDEDFKASLAIAKATAFKSISDFGAAIPALRDYLRLKPNGFEAEQARLDLVLALAHTRQYAEANQLLEDLWKSAKPLQTALHLAFLSGQDREYSIAAHWYRAVAQATDDPELREQAIAGIAFVSGHDLETSNPTELVEEFRTEIANGNAQAVASALALAGTMQQQGQLTTSHELYEMLVESWQSNEALVDAATACRCLLSLVNHSDKTNRDLQQRLGVWLEKLIANELEFEQRDAAIYQLAWCHFRSGDQRRAADAFVRLAERYPTSDYRDDAVYRAARIALDKGDLENGKRWLQKLIAVDSGSERWPSGFINWASWRSNPVIGSKRGK